MRKIILTTVFLASFAFSQNIKVLETETLVKNDSKTEFAFAKFSPQGDKVLYTSMNYKGLWIYDLNEKASQQLNDLQGAGYEPTFSTDGQDVFFRHDKLVKRRKFYSISHQSISDKTPKTLISEQRGISTPKALTDKVFVYKKDDMQITYSCKAENGICLLEKPVIDEITAYTENSNLYVEKNGEKTILNPVGEGHYIWGSISPNKDQVLFTLAGKGTYITDLKGNVILHLDYANYPSWAPDAEWIVYMIDSDDGDVITDSEIKATHIETQKSVDLTDTEDKLEMYPSWSPQGDEILYHTASGNIEMLKIEIQE